LICGHVTREANPRPEAQALGQRAKLGALFAFTGEDENRAWVGDGAEAME